MHFDAPNGAQEPAGQGWHDEPFIEPINGEKLLNGHTLQKDDADILAYDPVGHNKHGGGLEGFPVAPRTPK